MDLYFRNSVNITEFDHQRAPSGLFLSWLVHIINNQITLGPYRIFVYIKWSSWKSLIGYYVVIIIGNLKIYIFFALELKNPEWVRLY